MLPFRLLLRLGVRLKSQAFAISLLQHTIGTMSSSMNLLSLPSFFRSSFRQQALPLIQHRQISFTFGKFLVQKRLVIPVLCLPGSTDQETEPEVDATSSDSSSFYPSTSSDYSLYKWCAALGGIGFVETAYLSYLKLTGTAAFCSIGGGSCNDVLNSDYAAVFGVPLPLIGMAAYGLVGSVSLLLATKNLPFGVSESDGRLVILGTTTSMAVSSAYFMYILSSKLSGASCSYCLVSALLSFSLFFAALKDFGVQEITKRLGFQIFVASLVIFTLSASYNSLIPASSSVAEIDLPYYSTELTKPSSPSAISLARHLRSIGAKMYGAFWCSHCLEQKDMFGREAAELLDYVECFPNGFHKGTKMEKACTEAGIEGFPTWVVNGQVLSGEKELSELAEISGFKLEGSS